jgi:hypothetical protein
MKYLSFNKNWAVLSSKANEFEALVETTLARLLGGKRDIYLNLCGLIKTTQDISI